MANLKVNLEEVITKYIMEGHKPLPPDTGPERCEGEIGLPGVVCPGKRPRFLCIYLFIYIHGSAGGLISPCTESLYGCVIHTRVYGCVRHTRATGCFSAVNKQETQRETKVERGHMGTVICTQPPILQGGKKNTKHNTHPTTLFVTD